MKGLWHRARDVARMMVGQPSYDAYLAHMAVHHPGHTPMDRVAFFRNREEARFGAKGGGRCC